MDVAFKKRRIAPLSDQFPVFANANCNFVPPFPLQIAAKNGKWSAHPPAVTFFQTKFLYNNRLFNRKN
jgi:hypothetical protein